MKDKMRISVAMTTYNGEKYVRKQLESIFNQTRTPDEVVICDDGSTDKTPDIIIRFIDENQIKNWTLIRNNPNLGWKRNFYKAAGLTTGDIVFFSDQDDIWYNDKIETMVYLMDKYKMGCLFAEKQIIDSSNNLVIGRQDKQNYSGKYSKIPLKKSFYELKTLGCCMCVSRQIVNLYLELNFPEGGHDSQCGRLAVLFSSLWHLDSPVIKYRIHNNNTSGVSMVASFGQSNKKNRVENIKSSILWIERLLELTEIDNRKRQLLNECCNFQRMRLGFFTGRTSFFRLVCNFEYYRDLTMLFGDLAYKFNYNTVVGRYRWRISRLFN